SRGVVTAINRFFQLQIGLRALSQISNIAMGAMQRLGSMLTSIGRQAFSTVSFFENLRLSIETLTARDIAIAEDIPIDKAIEKSQEKVDFYLKSIEQLAVASPYNSQDIAMGFRVAQTYGFVGDEALALTQVATNL